MPKIRKLKAIVKVDYNLKNMEIGFWKKVQHKAIDLGISIRQLTIDALKDKLKRK